MKQNFKDYLDFWLSNKKTGKVDDVTFSNAMLDIFNYHT